MASCAVVTLNCNKQLQDSDTIRETVSSEIAGLDEHEFLVFCLQEMMPILDASMGWTEAYEAPFREAVDYAFVGKSIVGATGVLLFAKEPNSIAVLHKDSTAFGIMWSSLKGAALLSATLKYKRGKITFVSSHLCANEGYKAERDRDFNYMVDDLDISNIEGQVIVAGDLNYRTTDGTLDTDELRKSMNSGSIGKQFVESSIDFQPTYKFIPGTNRYRDEKRKPSYCDRILYRPLHDVQVKAYKAVMSEKLKTDHKPVVSSLHTPIKTRRVPDGWITDEDQSVVFSATEELTPNAMPVSPPSVAEFTAPPPPPLRIRDTRLSFGNILSPITDSVIGTALYALTTKQGRIAAGVVAILVTIAML